MKTLIRAAHVAAMTGEPLLEDGAVVMRGDRIIDVGPSPDLRRAHGDAHVEDLGDAVLMPGLVNAHAHLELSGIAQLTGAIPGGSSGSGTNAHPASPSSSQRPLRWPAQFVDWLLALRAQIQSHADWGQVVRKATAVAIQDSIRFGVTAVGDITSAPHLTRPILRDSPLAAVSFGEALGMAGRRAQLPARLAAALDSSHDRPDFLAGVEPHAPYSIDLPGYAQCLAEAKARGLPLATHLAETPDEAPFLADHTGDFARLWDIIGGPTDVVPTFQGGPIAAMGALGLLDYPTLLAHVNYASDADLGLLAAGRASVAYCPRTHAYFGHPPHRFAEMLARGVNVAVGTDSTASSPDLNLMDDLRLAHATRPDVPAMTIFEMATVRGARALQTKSEIGRLVPGGRADLCAFPARGPDPLSGMLESDVLPLKTWIAGALQSSRT